MIIRYQLSQVFKPHPKHQIFIISYQDLAVYHALVRSICEARQIEEHQYIEVFKSEDWLTVQNISQNYSLFQIPTCYEITVEKQGLPSKSCPELSPLIDDVFIIKTQQFKNSVFQQLASQDQVSWIQAYQPGLSDLWRWFQQRLHQLKYPIENDVQHFFLQQDGLDLSRCQQALEKWILTHPTPTIPLSIESLRPLLGMPQHEDWQPLMDAWLSQNLDLIASKFQLAKNEQKDLTLLVWLMSRNLQVAYALCSGLRLSSDVFQQFKVWPKVIPSLERWAKHLTSASIIEAIKDLQQTDIFIKTGQLTKAWHLIEKILLCTSIKHP